MPLTDLPTKLSFHEEAFLCAGSAFKLIAELIESEQRAVDHDQSLDLDNPIDFGKEYSRACQHVLKNALILTQQSYEMYLRGLVCEVSPYLLLIDQSSWTKKVANRSVSFSEMRTVNASELPQLCNAVREEGVPHQVTAQFHNLRELRNGAVHATSQRNVDKHQLVVQLKLILASLGWISVFNAYSAFQGMSHTAFLYNSYYEDYGDRRGLHNLIRAFRLRLGLRFTDEKLLDLDHVSDTVCCCCAKEIYQSDDISALQVTAIHRVEGIFCGVCREWSHAIRFGSKTVIYSLQDEGRYIVLNASGVIEWQPAPETLENAEAEIRKASRSVVP